MPGKEAAEAFDRFGKVIKIHLKLLEEMLAESVHNSTNSTIAEFRLKLKCVKVRL